MSIHKLHASFLDSVAQYEECERFWSSVIQGLSGSAGQSVDWKQQSSSSRWRVGNPIANARSEELDRAFRILQHRNNGDVLDFSWWTKHENDPAFVGESPLDELVIMLDLSEESLLLTKKLLAKWMTPSFDVGELDEFAIEQLSEAEGRFQNAADEGDPSAKATLGILALNREPSDPILAKKHFEAGAEHGSLDAMVGLGQLLEGGTLSAPDSAAAESWYSKAAEGGHVTAMVLLARLCARHKRHSESQNLLSLAAEAGDLGAMRLLSKLLQKSGDIAESERWFAASQGPH